MVDAQTASDAWPLCTGMTPDGSRCLSIPSRLSNEGLEARLLLAVAHGSEKEATRAASA